MSVPEHRGFLLTFLAVIVTALTAAAVLTYVLDPTGVLGTGVVEPVVRSDRDRKARLYRKLDAPPQILILGSSRVTSVWPGCIAALWGKTSFNFGFSAAAAEDYIAVWRFTRAAHRNPPLEILMAVEPEVFRNDDPRNEQLAASRLLRRYAPPATVDFPVRPARLLGFQLLRHDLRSLRALLVKPALQRIDRNGFFLGHDEEVAVRSGHYDLAAKIQAILPLYNGKFSASFTELAPARIAAFRRFLMAARTSRATVTAVMMPLHPDFIALMRRTTLSPRWSDTRRLLQQLGREGLLRYEDVTLESVGGDLVSYVDGAHVSEQNAARVLAHIHGGGRQCPLSDISHLPPDSAGPIRN